VGLCGLHAEFAHGCGDQVGGDHFAVKEEQGHNGGRFRPIETRFGEAMRASEHCDGGGSFQDSEGITRAGIKRSTRLLSQGRDLQSSAPGADTSGMTNGS
jgi:hypothetical protein